ncbi:hypothetical protein RRG08_000646 [Elysia crispata]|uniref:Uncharacterized protein n=1 Tax=Elysia crispata TaxID=231223 RepID=A0AAE0Y8R2_9GAST|nr:hypothetical protein RRG08_000646 [Elysia crispata]
MAGSQLIRRTSRGDKKRKKDYSRVHLGTQRAGQSVALSRALCVCAALELFSVSGFGLGMLTGEAQRSTQRKLSIHTGTLALLRSPRAGRSKFEQVSHDFDRSRDICGCPDHIIRLY